MAIKGTYQRTHLRHFLRNLRRRFHEMPRRMLACSLCGLLVTFAWGYLPFGSSLDQWALKKIFAQRGDLAVPNQIHLLGIDDETFEKLDLSPRQPFPRKYFATALENISASKPKLVILDLVGFRENDDEDANIRIEKALASVPTTIVRGFPEDTQRSLTKMVVASDSRFRKAAAMELSMYLSLENNMVWALSPLVNRPPTEGEDFPLLEPLRKYAAFNIPSPDRRGLINFYGPAGHIPRNSLYEIIQFPEKFSEMLKDKVVFVGFQSVARQRGQLNQEEFPVSISDRPMYGVEIHANIAGNLIDGSWLRRMSFQNEMLIMALSSSLVLFLALTLPLALSWVLLVGFIFCWAIVSYFAVVSFHFFLPGIMMLVVGLGLILGPISLLRALEELKKNKTMKAQLGIDT